MKQGHQTWRLLLTDCKFHMGMVVLCGDNIFKRGGVLRRSRESDACRRWRKWNGHGDLEWTVSDGEDARRRDSALGRFRDTMYHSGKRPHQNGTLGSVSTTQRTVWLSVVATSLRKFYVSIYGYSLVESILWVNLIFVHRLSGSCGKSLRYSLVTLVSHWSLPAPLIRTSRSDKWR